jgi:hypothetical protein
MIELPGPLPSTERAGETNGSCRSEALVSGS